MFQRIVNIFKGMLSLFVKGIEKRNPEALLELEQENLRKQIASFNQSLAAHAGLAERLIGQVRKLEAEEKELRARTTAHLRAGNKAAAAQNALRLQTGRPASWRRTASRWSRPTRPTRTWSRRATSRWPPRAARSTA
jgi:phage shock protein A